MKIRMMFVSNSSSSSSIVLLPARIPEYTLKTLPDKARNVIEYEDEITQEVIDCINDNIKLIASQSRTYNEEFSNGETFDVSEAMSVLMEPYEITSIDQGPDEGGFINIDRKKLKKIMDKE